MGTTLSRVLSAATGAYGVFALVNPRHLGAVLTDDRQQQQRYDLIATTYGFRDLAVSAVGVLGRSPQAVRTAMVIRIGCDLSDAVVIAPLAQSTRSRQKVLAATLGWASLNAIAVLVDRRSG